MKINHRCVIDILEANDILCEYIDNYTPRITYFFGSLGQLSFETSCIPIWFAEMALLKFGVTQLADLGSEKCSCQ